MKTEKAIRKKLQEEQRLAKQHNTDMLYWKQGGFDREYKQSKSRYFRVRERILMLEWVLRK